MKIVLIHYRYYEVSGPERYLFNISKVLKESGHEVIPFSLNYPENNDSEYSKFFPKPISEKFHINQQKNSISFIHKLKIIRNSFYNKEVYKKLQELIDFVNPDIAYVLQYGTKLSISIFDVLSNNNIPVVLRLSDFNLICAKNIFYRDGNICVKCIKHKYHSVIHKCVHGSVLQSLTYYGIQKVNEFRHFEKKIDAIITPSKFTYDLMTKSKQFKKNKFIHIPTFINKPVNDHKDRELNYNLNNGLKLCYVGRVADDKGIDFLIDAVEILLDKGLNVHLDIIGDDNNKFAELLKAKVKQSSFGSIDFKGFYPSDKINKLFSNYHYSIIPSKWFDNMPNSLIESCMAGVPVIASRIGSLDELIIDGVNGFTFYPLKSTFLADKIESLYSISENKHKEISSFCAKWIQEYCDKTSHYERLLNLFNKLINEKNSK